MDVDHGLVLEHSEVQSLIETLLESLQEHPLDILDIDPHPSDLSLALFAEGVYTDKISGETDEAYGERLDLPEGWRLLLTGSNSDLNNGYFGAAFIHTKLQQVVVAHRGTITTKVGPLYTDVVGILMNKYTSCMNSAITFMDHVRQVIDIVNAEPHKRCYNLAITGHSLGGWLAQITTFTAKWLKISHGALMKNIDGGIHAKTVAFDSPGAKNILDKMCVDYYTNYGTYVLQRLDIIVYVSAPNRINTCGLHIGTVYRVLIDFSTYKTSSYTERTHVISNFVEAFKTNSLNISEVLDWAKDSKEYYSLFEDETLNQDNNYHANFEKINNTVFLDEIVKHYNVPLPELNSFSMHLNAFSESELLILYQLIFFQKHQTDLKVLNKFIALKKLVFKHDKLFPDFEINHVNRRIKCQSKQILEELIRRLKQLMRWFRSEFVKTVEEQIWSLPRAVDSFYRAEGESFLELLPRSIFDFKDSLGLREFLLSDTDQILSIISSDSFEMSRLQNVFFQIQDSFNASHPINKYTNENHYTFLDWPRLQKLFKIYGSPIDQNNLMIVDGSLTSTVNSEVRNFLNTYVQCTPSNLKKLVFISAELQDDLFSSLENLKEVKFDQNIGLVDLSTESLEELLKRNLILTGSKFNSFQDFFIYKNCSIPQINQFICPDNFKKIATNKDYFITIKDTRPMICDLQMGLIKTTINVTSKEHVFNCVDLYNSLVVVSGLNRGDLETGAAWEQFNGKIILAEGDAELFFKDTCNKNQNKTIYLFEVSGDVIQCKQIFNQDFYVSRKLVHRMLIDLHKFAEVMQVDDMFVICSEEDKASLLALIGTCEKREEISKNLQIAGTKEWEARLIQKYYNKNIHFVKFEQSVQNFELEWRFSHGSVKSLIPFMSTDFFEPIDELTFSRTERNLVILIDEPGMGKTTTLARLSRLIETSWVIHIELRQFKAHIDSLSDQYTPQNVAIFLLSECCCSAGDRLAHGLLEYFLESKTCSKRVVLMFDGVDEIDDYIKNKDSSKKKLVKLFNFLQSKPAIQVFLTARKYLKESLETKLSQLSTSFETINTQEQQQFLFTFWRSFLPLELGNDREKAEGGLTEYAGEVLRRAKQVLGSDMDCFMGVPLQLRMLAEVFRPQSDLMVQPLENLYKKINIVSAPNLYKMYVNLKYDIYLNDKTLKGRALNEEEILEYTKSLTEDHGELGFKIFFPDFYDKNFEAIANQKLVKLNRLGLVQSKNREFHFIHRTYAEYFCAQIVVHWLIQQDSSFKYQLIKDVLLPKILLHPDSKVIRLFMNVELGEITMSDTTLQLNAEHISRLWFEENAIFRNDDHQTALHIAVQERNENIVTLLLSGLYYKSTQEAFVSFFIQYDINSETALHIIMDQSTFHGKTEDNRIMDHFFKCLETCSHKSKENILFSCLFNQDNILNYLHKSGNISIDTLTVLENVLIRIEKVKLEVCPVKEALLTNNIKLAKNILFRRLKNDVERYCLLLLKCEDHKIAYHLAIQNGQFGVVKLIAEQTSDLFNVLMTRCDNEKKTPLHMAAEFDHLDIVKFLVEHRADINTGCKLGKTALMYAAYCQHELIVKYLIESGAEINSVDNYGRTALYIAAGKENLSEVICLIKGGAEINSRDNDGWSALHISAGNDKFSTVKYLIESGAEINCKDNGGRTALNIAADNNNLSIVKYLTESGADINSDDNDSRTTHQINRGNDNLSIINIINIESVAEINFEDNDGRIAPHITRDNDIESGAEINCNDNDDRTTHQITRDNDNVSIINNNNIESGAEINFEENDNSTEHQITRVNNILSKVSNDIESDAEINSDDNDGRTEQEIARGNDTDISNSSIATNLVESGSEINSGNNICRNELHTAASGNNLSAVKCLIESGTEINCKDNNGWTALHIAAREDCLSLLKYLIKSGAEIHSTDNHGRTALHIAVIYRNLSIVEYLIKKGAEISRKDNNGWSVLDTAASIDNLLIFKYLYERCADIKNPESAVQLQIAVTYNILPILKYLIESGAQINSKDIDGSTILHIAVDNDHLSVVKYLFNIDPKITSIKNNHGQTAFHIAASKDSLSLVKYLIKSGVEINSEDNNGMTALHIAILYNKNFAIVKYIIKKGGEIASYIATESVTALHIAACKDNLSIFKYLFKSGADIKSKDITALLHIAVSNNNIPIVKYLFESGAQINSISNYGRIAPFISLPKNLIESRPDIISEDKNDGRTAIHMAVSKNNLSMVKYLLESGAEINCKDSEGATALHIAVIKNNLSTVKYLIESGAEINSVNNDGMTSLHEAVNIIDCVDAINCVNNDERIALDITDLSIIKHLIESGAEINLKNDDGCTALYIAADKGHQSVVEYLLQQGADLDKADNEGDTALTCASFKKKWKVVQILLEQGSDVNADNGKALSWAISWGEWSIVKSFIDKGASVRLGDIDNDNQLYKFKEKFPNYEFKKVNPR